MPRSKSVSGGLSFSLSDSLPHSVSLPVLMTSAFPLPLTTCVPIQRAFVRRPIGVSTRSTATAFSTGKVSPVIMAKAVAVLLVERSEEHTSELQSRLHLVCRLLLEKKKKKQDILSQITQTHT